jgi:hypothetical protein
MNPNETSVRALLASLGLGVAMVGCSGSNEAAPDAGFDAMTGGCGNAVACCGPSCFVHDGGETADADASEPLSIRDADLAEAFTCGNALCCGIDCLRDAGEDDQ